MTNVGFGSAVITPPLPVALAGFGGRAGPATEVRDDLEVRVLYARADGAGVCLIVCDLLGMSPEFANPVRRAVAAALDLPIEAVLTSCIHTHAGPSCMAGAEALGWPTPEGYLDILVNGCVAAAVEARGSAEPGTFHFSRQVLPEGLSINRRGLPYAPTFAVLDVRTPSGERLGALANVSIHPVALGPECLAVSSDWVGSFRTALESANGGRAVLLSGALGDVNPPVHAHATGPYDNDNFEDADALGQRVAAVVGDALATTTAVGDGVGVRRHRWIEVEAAGALAALAGIAGPMSVELIEWMLGDVRLVSVPGEAFHAMGNAIEEAKGGHVMLAGLAPVWQGYLPDPWGDGYEEGVSYGPAAVGAIREALVAPEEEHHHHD
ncbi:MAG: hypothetical protein QOF21_1214 [Actinomycetota bacterium]